MVETIDTNAMYLVYLDYSVAQKSCISYFIYKNYEENYINTCWSKYLLLYFIPLCLSCKQLSTRLDICQQFFVFSFHRTANQLNVYCLKLHMEHNSSHKFYQNAPPSCFRILLSYYRSVMSHISGNVSKFFRYSVLG
jgi:hypothetical protein